MIVGGIVLWGSQALGQEAVPAQIVVEPVPTPPARLAPLRVPRVAFAPPEASAEIGPDGLPVSGNIASPPPSSSEVAAQTPGAALSIVGTVSYPDKRMRSWATVVDGAGLRTVYVGDVLSGSVVTDISDGSIRLANGQTLYISSPSYSVPGISSNSFGAQTVPVNVAPSTPTATPAANPVMAVSPRPYVPGITAIPTPSSSPQPVQVLSPIGLPTPQTVTPASYPTPQALLPTGGPQHA